MIVDNYYNENYIYYINQDMSTKFNFFFNGLFEKNLRKKILEEYLKKKIKINVKNDSLIGPID